MRISPLPPAITAVPARSAVATPAETSAPQDTLTTSAAPEAKKKLEINAKALRVPVAVGALAGAAIGVAAAALSPVTGALAGAGLALTGAVGLGALGGYLGGRVGYNLGGKDGAPALIGVFLLGGLGLAGGATAGFYGGLAAGIGMGAMGGAAGIGAAAIGAATVGAAVGGIYALGKDPAIKESIQQARAKAA